MINWGCAYFGHDPCASRAVDAPLLFFNASFCTTPRTTSPMASKMLLTVKKKVVLLSPSILGSEPGVLVPCLASATSVTGVEILADGEKSSQSWRRPSPPELTGTGFCCWVC